MSHNTDDDQHVAEHRHDDDEQQHARAQFEHDAVGPRVRLGRVVRAICQIGSGRVGRPVVGFVYAIHM